MYLILQFIHPIQQMLEFEIRPGIINGNLPYNYNPIPRKYPCTQKLKHTGEHWVIHETVSYRRTSWDKTGIT